MLLSLSSCHLCRVNSPDCAVCEICSRPNQIIAGPSPVQDTQSKSPASNLSSCQTGPIQTMLHSQSQFVSAKVSQSYLSLQQQHSQHLLAFVPDCYRIVLLGLVLGYARQLRLRDYRCGESLGLLLRSRLLVLHISTAYVCCCCLFRGESKKVSHQSMTGKYKVRLLLQYTFCLLLLSICELSASTVPGRKKETSLLACKAKNDPLLVHTCSTLKTCRITLQRHSRVIVVWFLHPAVQDQLLAALLLDIRLPANV